MSKPRRRGPQPKQRCEYCGRMLSMQAMKRHVGTDKCVAAYWRRQLASTYARPAGMRAVYGQHTYILLPLFRKAGLSPNEMPLQQAVVWEPRPQGQWDPGPSLETFVPTWLAIVLDMMLVEHQEARSAQHKALVAGDKELAKHGGTFAVFEQDIITLLDYLEARPDEALGLSAELDLVAKRTEDTRTWYDKDAVREVLRRWASDALTNL